jgi:hypothetical protein
MGVRRWVLEPRVLRTELKRAGWWEEKGDGEGGVEGGEDCCIVTFLGVLIVGLASTGVCTQCIIETILV